MTPPLPENSYDTDSGNENKFRLKQTQKLQNFAADDQGEINLLECTEEHNNERVAIGRFNKVEIKAASSIEATSTNP